VQHNAPKNNHGNIAIKSLNEQTSATYNILQDLESGKYAPDVARVHLDEAYYSIVERVNALAVVEGSADYEPFIRKMNINVVKFSLLMPVRKKQGKRGGKTSHQTEEQQ
jgi:aminopeptidase N